MSLSHTPRRQLAISLILAATLLLIPASALAQNSTPTPVGGYYYVVQAGDTWGNLSARTGIPVRDLMAANPTLIRPNGWLYIGDRLFIPAQPSPAAPGSGTAGGYWYQVKPGDTWQTVSAATGVPVAELVRANPTQVRPNGWLYIGQRLWIPAVSPPSTGTAAPAASAPGAGTPTPGATAPAGTPAGRGMVPGAATPTAGARTVPASPGAPSTPVATSTVSGVLGGPPVLLTAVAAAVKGATGLSGLRPTPQPTATPTPAVRGAGTPKAGLGTYPAAIAAFLDKPGNNTDTLRAWLTSGGLITAEQGTVAQASIQAPTSRDVVVVIRDPESTDLFPRTMLLVYLATPTGHKLVRQVEGAGSITFLRGGDINADGKGDIVWTDTTCGAHTCFSTLFVESLDGGIFRDWIAGEPTMANARYRFENTLPGGSGDEILAYGGIIGSVGAGPQRAWTETYASAEGRPYELHSQVYDASRCLYHAILDANKAFSSWVQSGFEPAIQAYRAAIENPNLEACGTITDELAWLRDFARLRMMIAHTANGDAAQAAALRAQIETPALLGAAEAFLSSYQSSVSVVQACRDVAAYAEANPASWQPLSDWGYANPSFGPGDLCPLD